MRYAEPHPESVDPRRRLAVVRGVIALALWGVGLALVVFDVRWAGRYQAAAARPLLSERELPAPRGRILTRDGAVLAQDRQTYVLSLEYRWLESPPQASWLRSQARRRLRSAERRDPRRLEEAQTEILAEREALHRRLAELSGISREAWQVRTAAVQRRIERIVASVDRRSRERADLARQAPAEPGPWWRWMNWSSGARDAAAPRPRPATDRIVVREELTDHPLVDDLAWEAVAELSGHPERYPGVHLQTATRRIYPRGELAAHVVGYVSQERPSFSNGPEPGDEAAVAWSGKAGVERLAQAALRPQPGRLIEWRDRSGRTLGQRRQREPRLGRDVVLSLDARLQQSAEQLLGWAIQRGAAGGAVVALDIRTGAVLAAASAPGYSPATLVDGPPSDVERLLADPAHRLFDRAIAMALPPGSLFGLVVAAAAWESQVIDGEATIACPGYWRREGTWPCPLAARDGQPHPPLGVLDAVSQGCTTCLLELGAAARPTTIIDQARRWGWGHRPGSGLLGEAAGRLPWDRPDEVWSEADMALLASGQGDVLVTPLQMARSLAAIANGGRLLRPRWVLSTSSGPGDQPPGAEGQEPVRLGLHPQTLQQVRQVLSRAVSDRRGRSHTVLFASDVSVAAISGTAAAGNSRARHGWFAGYAPAEAPRVAVVVALEREAGQVPSAGPVARNLLAALADLGYLSSVVLR